MITGRALLAGVMGWPVAHSLSPILHNYWLEQTGIDGAFVPLPVAPQDLRPAFAALPKLGFRGWNLTVPHKEAALHLVDEIDDEARAIGAVNTVTVRADGSLLGSNTDAYGFIANLRAHHAALDSCLERVLVIGAGGAARAVVHALHRAGAREVIIVNRTRARAEALCAPGGRALDWGEREKALAHATLLVNATTLGMRGQPPLELSLEHLPRETLVADIVYVPLMTPLLREALARGNAIVTGIGMLIHQAVPGFTSWFGAVPPLDATLEERLLA